MTKVCAECHKVIEPIIEGTPDDGIISHGTCPVCAKAERDRLRNLDKYSGNLEWQGWAKDG
jgi:hypothetical protein